MEASPVFLSKFKAGQSVQQFAYKAFIPEKIDRAWHIDVPDVQVLTAEAHRRLGELDAFSELMPDVSFFIKTHIAKEATQSSRIEGTRTLFEETFLAAADLAQERRDDWQEVQNYIEALNEAIESLEKLPLSNRLLRQAHRRLMQGVRGEMKQPGEFRISQNWIGGATLADAIFIPPPAEELPELMGDLEKFLHNPNIQVPPLVKIGIAHYQFETIHPFLDGNGRTGRLLIPLFLISSGLLKRPALYISDFFERNKSLYYDNLTRVRTHGDLAQWLRFFMVGVIETSQHSTETFRQIIRLKAVVLSEIALVFGKKQAIAVRLLNILFQKPVLTAKDVEQTLSVSSPTAQKLVADFEKYGILSEKTGMQRNRVYVFRRYLDCFER